MNSDNTGEGSTSSAPSSVPAAAPGAAPTAVRAAAPAAVPDVVPTRASRSNPFRVLFEHRNFRLFWTGQTLSLIGTWMQSMAMGWLALELSNSAFIVGLVTSVSAIPVVLFSMHAGALVDHGDRLKIVRGAQVVYCLEATVLWLITITGVVSIPWLLMLSFVRGCCNAIEVPARQSLFIQLVGREDLQPAIALNSSGFNLARIVGPSIAGVVINRFGLGWCFGLNALSYGAVLWGLALIRLPERVAVQYGHWMEVLRQSTHSAGEGVRYLLQPGAVRELLVLLSVSSVLGAPFLTLVPVVARDQLHLDAAGYGSLLTAVGVGGLVGALLVAGPLSQRASQAPVMRAATYGFPVVLIGFALSGSQHLSWVWLFMAGVWSIMFGAITNSALQLLVEEKFRGRLMAFYGLVFLGLSQAVGSLMLGALARLTTAGAAIAASASLLLVITVAMRKAEFWRRI